MKAQQEKMPGFTAEATLYKSTRNYERQATDFLRGTGDVVPAAQCCAPCGEDLCCDDCPPEPPPDDPHGDPRRGIPFEHVRFYKIVHER